MKLRIKGNSIRLRLLRSEVEQFASVGQISETIEFGGHGFLRYSLVISPEAENPVATFRGNEIAITVPSALAGDWTSGDGVGFEAEQPLPGGGSLAILVEKDFACLDRVDDPDRHDAYENPNAVC